MRARQVGTMKLDNFAVKLRVWRRLGVPTVPPNFLCPHVCPNGRTCGGVAEPDAAHSMNCSRCGGRRYFRVTSATNARRIDAHLLAQEVA